MTTSNTDSINAPGFTLRIHEERARFSPKTVGGASNVTVAPVLHSLRPVSVIPMSPEMPAGSGKETEEVGVCELPTGSDEKEPGVRSQETE